MLPTHFVLNIARKHVINQSFKIIAITFWTFLLHQIARKDFFLFIRDLSKRLKSALNKKRLFENNFLSVKK